MRLSEAVYCPIIIAGAAATFPLKPDKPHRTRFGWGGVNPRSGRPRRFPSAGSCNIRLNPAHDLEVTRKGLPQIKPSVVKRFFREVFRTNTRQPGFVRIEADIPGLTPEKFRALLMSLAQTISKAYNRQYPSFLGIRRTERFNALISTDMHRDAAKPHSLIILGYEPSTVKSRLRISDCTQWALDRGVLNHYAQNQYWNLRPDEMSEVEAHYTMEVPGWNPKKYQILVINNGITPIHQSSMGMLGVAHQADVESTPVEGERYLNTIDLDNHHGNLLSVPGFLKAQYIRNGTDITMP